MKNKLSFAEYIVAGFTYLFGAILPILSGVYAIISGEVRLKGAATWTGPPAIIFGIFMIGLGIAVAVVLWPVEKWLRQKNSHEYMDSTVEENVEMNGKKKSTIHKIGESYCSDKLAKYLIIPKSSGTNTKSEEGKDKGRKKWGKNSLLSG